MAMNSALNYSIRQRGASFAVFVLDVSSLAPVHDNILTRPKVLTWLRRTFAGGLRGSAPTPWASRLHHDVSAILGSSASAAGDDSPKQ